MLSESQGTNNFDASQDGSSKLKGGGPTNLLIVVKQREQETGNHSQGVEGILFLPCPLSHLLLASRDVGVQIYVCFCLFDLILYVRVSNFSVNVCL